MNVTPEKDVWLREGRTVYTLMHHGWIKGEEKFRNRLYFNLQYDHKTVTAKEAENVTANIVKAINAHDDLVAGLREIMEQSVCGSWYYEKAKSVLAAAGEPV
jgi:hypothetical protein